MTADHILIWMSAKGEGSWAQFTQAVETLSASDSDEEADDDSESSGSASPAFISSQNLLRLNLSRLGHAEFFNEDGRFRWRIVPPAISTTETANGALGVLCGARIPALRESLERICRDNELQTSEIADGPEAITISADSFERLAEIAEECHLILQPNAPEALLLSQPDILSSFYEIRSRLPAGEGWTARRFHPSSLSWQESSPAEASNAPTGLFEIHAGFPWRHMIADGKAFVELPKAVGIYRTLKQRRRQVFRFREKDQSLTIRAACRPPLLVERALILRSGVLPEISKRNGQGKFATYPNISKPLAESVSSILFPRH